MATIINKFVLGVCVKCYFERTHLGDADGDADARWDDEIVGWDAWAGVECFEFLFDEKLPACHFAPSYLCRVSAKSKKLSPSPVSRVVRAEISRRTWSYL